MIKFIGKNCLEVRCTFKNDISNGKKKSTFLQIDKLRSSERKDSWQHHALFHNSQSSCSQEPQGSSMVLYVQAAMQQNHENMTESGILKHDCST